MCRCGCVAEIKGYYTGNDGTINHKVKYAVITSIATTIIGTICMPIYMYYAGKADHESTGKIIGGMIVPTLLGEVAFIGGGFIVGFIGGFFKENCSKNDSDFLPLQG